MRLEKAPRGLGVSWNSPDRCCTVDLSRRAVWLTLPSSMVPAASEVSISPSCSGTLRRFRQAVGTVKDLADIAYSRSSALQGQI